MSARKKITFITGSFRITVPITVAYNDLRFVIQQRVDSTIENQRSVWKRFLLYVFIRRDKTLLNNEMTELSP